MKPEDKIALAAGAFVLLLGAIAAIHDARQGRKK